MASSPIDKLDDVISTLVGIQCQVPSTPVPSPFTMWPCCRGRHPTALSWRSTVASSSASATCSNVLITSLTPSLHDSLPLQVSHGREEISEVIKKLEKVAEELRKDKADRQDKAVRRSVRRLKKRRLLCSSSMALQHLEAFEVSESASDDSIVQDD